MGEWEDEGYVCWEGRLGRETGKLFKNKAVTFARFCT